MPVGLIRLTIANYQKIHRLLLLRRELLVLRHWNSNRLNRMNMKQESNQINTAPAVMQKRVPNAPRVPIFKAACVFLALAIRKVKYTCHIVLNAPTANVQSVTIRLLPLAQCL